MKKRLKLTALAFSLLFCFPAYADETGFYVNNSYVESETVQNESGVFVPLRAIAEGLGFTVSWKNPYVVISDDTTEIKVCSGSSEALKNKETVSLSNIPYIFNDRVMISLSDMEKITDCKSEYDKDGSLKIRSSFPYDNGHPMVDGYMEKINALAYYNAGGYVYYITLGDLEGVHRMLFDGSEDIILQNLDGMEIGANTKVSITYNGSSLIITAQELSQTDENGNVEKPHPVHRYEIKLENGY